MQTHAEGVDSETTGLSAYGCLLTGNGLLGGMQSKFAGKRFGAWRREPSFPIVPQGGGTVDL